MNRYIKALSLTPNGRPVLLDDARFVSVEVELIHVEDVSLYLGDEKKYKNGRFVLTNHRVLWLGHGANGPLSLCFSMSVVDKLTTESTIFRSPKILVHLKELVIEDKSHQPPSPGYLKLSFHSGKQKEFMQHMEAVFIGREWEIAEAKPREKFSTKTAGIGGIISRKKEREEKEGQVLQGAFQDLDALMKMAKDVVSMAERFSATAGAKTDEFESVLANLGISSPVTKESAGSAYHRELSRQLADFITPYLTEAAGTLQLVDVYCLYNRARGTELVSPDDLLIACNNFAQLGIPISLLKFDSGVMVLQSNDFNEQGAASKILEVIEQFGPVTPLDLAQELGISIALAKKHLYTSEELLYLCRESTPYSTRFWKNIFIQ